MSDQLSIGTDAETAEMFGDLVKQNIQNGADPETVGEWARYAARYAERALARSERMRDFALGLAGDVLAFEAAVRR